MTLYKATLEQIDDLDIEPQIEPTRLMLNLQVMQGSTIGIEALINLGVSNNISQQAWKSLPQVSHTSTTIAIQSIDGTLKEPVGYVDLTNEVNGHVITSRFFVMPTETMDEHMVLGRTWHYQVNCQVD